MTELEKQQAERIRLLEEQNRLLQEKVDYLVRVIHSSRSEKIDPDQLELLLDPEAAKKTRAADCEEGAPAAENIILIDQGKRTPRKPRLPENIATTEEVIIPEEVKANPDAYRQVGQEVSERLNVEPTRYTRHLIIRPTYLKRGGDEFVTAQLPPCLREGSILTPSLLAHVLTARYNDHLPFDRQSKIARLRHGVNLPSNTLCNWAELGAFTLQPLYNLIASGMSKSDRLNIDETPVTYLDKDNGGSKQGYFWVYRNAGGVLYDWHIGRGHDCLDNVLVGDEECFTGMIQCDGYSAYQTWAGKHKGIILLGCWAHARRKFTEALPYTQDAAVILHFIQRLYKTEDQYRRWLQQSNHPPETIGHYRRRHHKKLLNGLRYKLHQLQKQHLPKSAMGKAIGYALNQWHRLCLAVKHSATLDNNAAENAVRPLKLGAKNWLFIGHGDTGWRGAVIYTLIENCRILGHDPYAYLKWVFEKLPAMTNQDDLRPLLPVNWAAKCQSQDTTSLAG